MRLAVVFATLGRPAIIAEAINLLKRQTRAPDIVVISAVDPSDVGKFEAGPLLVQVVYGRRGLCVQRNTGLEHLHGRADIVLFLDDDFVMADDYIALVADLFSSAPDIAGIEGRVVADGATNAGYTVADAMRFLREDDRPSSIVRNCQALYGCNMAYRVRSINGLRFDERLPLYGWLEDVDFSYALGKNSRLVNFNQATGVHLGTKTGRTSGVRFGYSQIANPIYLWRKGTIPPGLLTWQISRNVISNVAKSLLPESYIDRRGRLRGNFLGVMDLLLARLRPERVLEIK